MPRSTHGTATHRSTTLRKPLATAALSAVAVGLSFIAEKVGIPAAWIFAFLVVFGIYAIVGDRQVTPPKKAMIPAQVIVALLCTAPLTTSSLATIASYAGPTIISLAVTLAVCALASWLLVRFHRTSPTTATLATLAGGASAMVMLSNELKADTRFVTLTQYLRVSIVVLTLPAFVGVLGTLADSGPGEAGVASPQETVTSEMEAPERIGPVGRYIIDPDGAVVRAGLVRHYAARHGLWQLDPRIAYLTGDTVPERRRGFEVREVVPMKQLKAALAARGVGAVEILIRGVDVTPEALRKKWKLKGSEAATVVLTRVGTKAWGYICDPVRG